MKNIFIKIFSLLPVAMISTNVIAHPGHMADESVHGFLHVEHIVALIAMIVVAAVIAWSRDK